jgi:hypothetical protein
MFENSNGKGFHMTFGNGKTVSVQWGFGNYCDNRNNYEYMDSKDVKSSDCEIAIWNEKGLWITKEVFKGLYNEELYDDVEGYLTTDKVAEIINYVKNM